MACLTQRSIPLFSTTIILRALEFLDEQHMIYLVKIVVCTPYEVAQQEKISKWWMIPYCKSHSRNQEWT